MTNITDLINLCLKFNLQKNTSILTRPPITSVVIYPILGLDIDHDRRYLIYIYIYVYIYNIRIDIKEIML